MIRHIFENITACKEAAYVDIKTSGMLMKLPGIKPINKTEDLLLALAASDTVDLLYYCSTLKFYIDDSTYIVNIYLEFSAFEEFLANMIEELIKVELSIEEVLPDTIYTKADIEKKRARTNNLYGSQKIGNFDLSQHNQPKYEIEKNKELKLLLTFLEILFILDLELKQLSGNSFSDGSK